MVTESTEPLRVSVIIAARNAARTLGAQLEALSRQSFQGWWELIVVDNGSIDDTAKVAEAWRTQLPCLHIMDAPSARGSAGARNAGAVAARGDVLLFCDADDVATPTWILEMVSAARSADIVGGYRDFHPLNTPRARSWRAPIPPHRLPMALGHLPYVPTSCLGVRAETFHSLGGFNEDHVGTCYDVDFCWRAQLASYTISFAPDAVMHYRLRDRFWPMIKQAYGYGRDTAQLIRDFRPYGLSAVSALNAAEGWYKTLCRVLRSDVDRGQSWFMVAGIAGQLAGSISYRGPYLQRDSSSKTGNNVVEFACSVGKWLRALITRR